MAAGAYVHILKGPDVPVQLGVGGIVDVAETQSVLVYQAAVESPL